MTSGSPRPPEGWRRRPFRPHGPRTAHIVPARRRRVKYAAAMGCALLTHASRTSSRNFTETDRKSTRLNSSHLVISYAVFCLKKKKKKKTRVKCADEQDT